MKERVGDLAYLRLVILSLVNGSSGLIRSSVLPLLSGFVIVKLGRSS